MKDYRPLLRCPHCRQHSIYYKGRDVFYCAACEEEVDP